MSDRTCRDCDNNNRHHTGTACDNCGTPLVKDEPSLTSKPKTTINGGVMTGYGVRIEQLNVATITQYALGDYLASGQHDPANCVAVFGSDMGESLACVVDLHDGDNNYPVLVWADRSDAEGVPLFAEHGEFAEALHDVLTAVMPHLRRG